MPALRARAAARARSEQGLPPLVGRLLGDMGVRELAEAMRLLKPHRPGLSLTLVGASGAANRTAIMPAEVAGWKAEGLLHHAGQVGDVRPLIAAADAVILPSYREGMPRALLEAAAMGRPLLAPNVSGCRSLVRDGENGFPFEARSSENLAALSNASSAYRLPSGRRWAPGLDASQRTNTTSAVSLTPTCKPSSP